MAVGDSDTRGGPSVVRRLLGEGYGTIRDLAMITLMYRAEFKMSELLALERRHFNPGEPFILRPAGKEDRGTRGRSR